MLLLVLTSINLHADEIWRQPAGYPEGLDTWFGSFYNTSAQHDYRLRIGGWGDYYYTLMRFNLSGLPLVATQVRFYRYTFNDGGTPTPINWWKIGQQWQPSSVSYSTFPWGTLVPWGQSSVALPNKWYYVDITGFYNSWRSGKVGSQNYGLLLSAANNNNNYSSFYSSSSQNGYGPILWVSYSPQGTDRIIKLRWPLSTAKPANPSSGGAFGDPWGMGITSCVGLPMKHAGVDIPSPVGNPVYATEDGFVKRVYSASGWAYAIVMEHNHPVSGKFTTVYWHVNPVFGVVDPSQNGGVATFVPKGMQIATIADISPRGSHLHLGVRNGTYNNTYSDKGALPAGYCSQLTTFPENFINPWNASQVIFH